MSTPPASQSNPHAIIEIGDRTFDSWKHEGFFESVSVELMTDDVSQLAWKVFDPTFRFVDQFTREDGIPMVVMRAYLGYGPNLGEPVFKGLLIEVQHGARDATFVAFDMSELMRLEKRPGYNKGTDLEVMRRLVTRHEPLQFSGPDAGFPPDRIQSSMQDDQNDWEHFKELTDNAGLITWVEMDTVNAKEPGRYGQPVQTFRRGVDFELLRDYDFKHRTPESQEGRPRRVEVRTRGGRGQRLTGVSKVGTRGRKLVESTRSLKDQSTAGAKRRADAKKAQEREKAFDLKIRTTLPLPNRHRRLRETVEVLNIGKLASGLYVIDQITYTLEAQSVGVDYRVVRDIKEIIHGT